MHLCDASVWVALSIGTHEHHPVATGWLASVEDEHTIFFCRATQQSLLRLLTTAAVTAPYGEAPMSNAQAWEAYRAFLADPRIVIRSDEPRRVGVSLASVLQPLHRFPQTLDGRVLGGLHGGRRA